jgi:hypothetical protein
MVHREPTEAELAVAEREIMKYRGARILAADHAKTDAAASESRKPADPASLQPSFCNGPHRCTERQVHVLPAACRANYAAFDGEIRKLVEARLAAALTAVGYASRSSPSRTG